MEKVHCSDVWCKVSFASNDAIHFMSINKNTPLSDLRSDALEISNKDFGGNRLQGGGFTIRRRTKYRFLRC